MKRYSKDKLMEEKLCRAPLVISVYTQWEPRKEREWEAKGKNRNIPEFDENTHLCIKNRTGDSKQLKLKHFAARHSVVSNQ